MGLDVIIRATKKASTYFTVFFAAVLGFGLKHLLDLDTPPMAQNPVGIFPFNGLPYKWLFFLVATFIFLRFLTGSANHLWLEYQRDPRDYGKLDDIFIMVSFFWLTVFACFGAYLCYAGNPSQFFWRAGYLLAATSLASVLQVLWHVFRWLWSKLKRVRTRSSSIGGWHWVWLGSNLSQLLAVVALMNGCRIASVVALMNGCVGRMWGTRLLILAIVSAVILIIDFYWQLQQLSKPPPNETTTEARAGDR